MPYANVPALVSRLDAPDEPGEITRLALRFLILTATRTSEVLGARRSEIDQDAAVWTIPAERYKAGREHRVPLSAPALLIVVVPASYRPIRICCFPPPDSADRSQIWRF